MTPVKRLEIVVDARSGRRVTELLDQCGVPGWTLLRRAEGSGDRGRRYGDELTGVENNQVVLVACPPELLDQVLEGLRPLLSDLGGICMISDADLLQI